MVEKKYKVSYLGSGPMGFTEVKGVAGEDLAENDVVGYFNKPNNIEVVTNNSLNSGKRYFDNGNKYFYPFSSTGVGATIESGTNTEFNIYDTNTNEIIETRTCNTSNDKVYTFDSIEEPNLEWAFTIAASTYIYIYKHDGSNYTKVAEIKTNYVSTNFNIKEHTSTNNYLVIVVQGMDRSTNGSTYLKVYTVDKKTYAINSKEITVYGDDADYDTSFGYSYNDNYIYMTYCIGSSSSTYYTGYAVYMDLFENNPLQITSNKSKYRTSKRVLYCKDRFKYIYIYDNYVNSSTYGIACVWIRNEKGTVYTYESSSNKSIYLCSVSDDFNEVIIYNYTDKKFFFINVEKQTCEDLTNNTPSYYITNSYSLNIDIGSCASVVALNDAVNPSKIAYIKNFNSSFNKIDHCGQGLFEYVGIVKNDCKQGENVTVYKIIDF